MTSLEAYETNDLMLILRSLEGCIDDESNRMRNEITEELVRRGKENE